jgi:hypothetical protein
MQWDASFLSLHTPCPIKCNSPLYKVGFPHLSVCHMKYCTTVYYNPACLYLSLGAAESHSDMWLVVMKLPDSTVSIWGTRVIIQEISSSTDFSLSWPTQGKMYPQRCSGQTLIFEILKVSNDDVLFSGLLSFWSLFTIWYSERDWDCVFLVNPDGVPPSPFTWRWKQKLVLSEQSTKEKVQKFSNAEYHHPRYLKTKWENITQTECILMMVIHS